MEAKIPLRVIPLSLLPRPGQNLIRGTLQETKNIKCSALKYFWLDDSLESQLQFKK